MADVRPAGPDDRDWLAARLKETWGSHRIALRGALVDLFDHPILLAGERDGVLVHRRLAPGTAEILLLEAFHPGRGIGSRLVETHARLAASEGLSRLEVVTTNDNLAALRFYQRRGFHLLELHPGAVTEARARLKPEIPLRGAHGIEIRDEIVLVRHLSR